MAKKYYCLCDSNCKYETMTAEQIMAAIQQAAQLGLVYDPDAAVVTKVREKNGGQSLSFWLGTQAQYNAISKKDQYCYYIITDKEETDVSAQVAAALDAANEAKEIANAMPAFYFSETEPANWKSGDIWLKPAEG